MYYFIIFLFCSSSRLLAPCIPRFVRTKTDALICRVSAVRKLTGLKTNPAKSIGSMCGRTQWIREDDAPSYLTFPDEFNRRRTHAHPLSSPIRGPSIRSEFHVYLATFFSLCAFLHCQIPEALQLGLFFYLAHAVNSGMHRRKYGRRRRKREEIAATWIPFWLSAFGKCKIIQFAIKLLLWI